MRLSGRAAVKLGVDLPKIRDSLNPENLATATEFDDETANGTGAVG